MLPLVKLAKLVKLVVITSHYLPLYLSLIPAEMLSTINPQKNPGKTGVFDLRFDLGLTTDPNQ